MEYEFARAKTRPMGHSPWVEYHARTESPASTQDWEVLQGGLRKPKPEHCKNSWLLAVGTYMVARLNLGA